VLALPEKVLQQVLSSNVAREQGIHDAFQNLIACRLEQVERGYPISALGVGASAMDVRVRAIALLSERIEMQPGESWNPVPDDDPCGPYIGVLVKGHAMIEIGSSRHLVTQLTPGSIFIEGMAASYGACARAETYCEAYRVRKSDFTMAVGGNPAAGDWLWRFRLLEKTAEQQIRMRLESVQGLVQLGVPNARDSEIQAWKLRRKENMKKAQTLKQQTEGEAAFQRLPPLSQVAGCKAADTTSAQSSVHTLRQSSTTSLASVAALKPGLMSYPVLQLPKLPTEKKKERLLHMSKSESSFCRVFI